MPLSNVEETTVGNKQTQRRLLENVRQLNMFSKMQTHIFMVHMS
jgi:hypothetical protein